jgi:hypothetical protein
VVSGFDLLYYRSNIVLLMVPMIRWEEEEQESWSRAAAAFPGVETRKVNMHKYNGKVEEGGGKDGEGATRWRQLLFYRIILDDGDGDSDAAPGRREAEPVDLNLHAAAHLYASDRNSLFLIQRAAGFQRVRTDMASLSHTVIFHQPADSLCMVDDQGKPKWFVQESWTSFSADKRGCHNSYLWDFEKGLVLATTIQDGMIRFPHSIEGRPETDPTRAEELADQNKSKL